TSQPIICRHEPPPKRTPRPRGPRPAGTRGLGPPRPHHQVAAESSKAGTRAAHVTALLRRHPDLVAVAAEAPRVREADVHALLSGRTTLPSTAWKRLARALLALSKS